MKYHDIVPVTIPIPIMKSRSASSRQPLIEDLYISVTMTEIDIDK